MYNLQWFKNWLFIEKTKGLSSKTQELILRRKRKMHATMTYIIEMICTVFVTAYLLPPAITAIMAANTTGGTGGVGAWSAAVVTIFQVLLPILVIITVALALMPPEVKSKVGL